MKIIAAGAGCCDEILNNVAADFIITGELGHHQILHEVHRGLSLIVTDHTRTERGFGQKVFKKKMEALTVGAIECIVSETDRDPLEYI